MIIKAHAKINLMLNVLGSRPDGYHEIETIMQTLDLYDIVAIAVSPNIEIEVVGADLPDGSENLAYQAADILRNYVGYSGGVKIKLIKRIPLAAGLAGGSADAAAVLRGLNKFWGLGLELKELAVLGARIGSDVPFCVQNGTALVRGRGEIVSLLPDLPSLGVVLVKPSFGVSTADIYHRYDSILDPVQCDCQSMLYSINQGDVDGLVTHLANSLELVTISLYPVIEEIKKDLLAEGALGVLMSGSGPTVFGLYKNQALALRASNKFKKDGFWVKATQFTAPSRR